MNGPRVIIGADMIDGMPEITMHCADCGESIPVDFMSEDFDDLAESVAFHRFTHAVKAALTSLPTA